MITKNNFKNRLKSLYFQEEKGVFSKHFPNIDASLKADFNECVHRLFEKGHKSYHIELEPK